MDWNRFCLDSLCVLMSGWVRWLEWEEASPCLDEGAWGEHTHNRTYHVLFNPHNRKKYTYKSTFLKRKTKTSKIIVLTSTFSLMTKNGGNFHLKLLQMSKKWHRAWRSRCCRPQHLTLLLLQTIDRAARAALKQQKRLICRGGRGVKLPLGFYKAFVHLFF